MAKSKFRTKGDEAYHRLRQMIEAGKFDSGRKLTERGAAEMLGMGRLGVREAMHRLEAEGLLHGRHERQGRYFDCLEDADPEQVLERYEVREAIEAQAARLAATNMSEPQAEQFLELARRVETCLATDDYDKRSEAKMAFIGFLMANCGNRLLHRVWRTHRLLPYAPRNRQLNEQILDRKKGERTKWTLMAEAIAARDKDEAERLSREGCRQITEALRRTLMGSGAAVSTSPVCAEPTTDQETDSLPPLED